jgi:hypothetical protein
MQQYEDAVPTILNRGIIIGDAGGNS